MRIGFAIAVNFIPSRVTEMLRLCTDLLNFMDSQLEPNNRAHFDVEALCEALRDDGFYVDAIAAMAGLKHDGENYLSERNCGRVPCIDVLDAWPAKIVFPIKTVQ